VWNKHVVASCWPHSSNYCIILYYQKHNTKVLPIFLNHWHMYNRTRLLVVTIFKITRKPRHIYACSIRYKWFRLINIPHQMIWVNPYCFPDKYIISKHNIFLIIPVGCKTGVWNNKLITIYIYLGSGCGRVV
jgi:hypothetical protein